MHPILRRILHGPDRAPVQAPRRAVRMYQGAKSNRTTIGFGTADSSADSQLQSSLRPMRSRARQLVRDAAYAKRAKWIVQTNVVGAGVGIQAIVETSRGGMAERVNAAIEREWAVWCRPEHCHTGGVLHFADMEAMIVGQVFEAGENLIRKHYDAFGGGKVPLALEVVEAERLPEDVPQYPAPGAVGQVRMGVEVDKFMRPLAFWLRNSYPGDIKPSLASEPGGYVRVPAADIVHLKVTSRWPQTRGEPWLHAAMRKLNDMDGYSEAEIVAARGAASYMGVIKKENPEAAIGDEQEDGEKQLEFEAGTFQELGPGEDIEFNTPNRPNAAMDPFMRMMLREVAAGIGVSYESLSRDYSQTTYSSGRLALLDDRDLWRALQQWYIRAFREPLHREWLRSAVLSGSIPEISVDEYMRDPAKFEAVRFKPRGWSWVDPTKEVEAYKEAVRCGFTTVADVIAKTGDGMDIEDVLQARKQELEDMHAAGLVFDTDPAVQPTRQGPAPEAKEPAQTAEPPAGGAPARIVKISEAR